MIILGVDPGLGGGLSRWLPAGDAAPGTLSVGMVVMKTPTLSSGKKAGKILDENRLQSWFGPTDRRPHHAFIERASAMPKQGVTSVFTFGTGYGLIRGILVGLGIPYTIVSPKDWQGEMLRGVSKGNTKAASIIVAHRLFPKLAEQIGKHHGMSDALLICEYGRRLLKA